MPVLAACLRNARVVAEWCRDLRPVAVIASGEQWPGGILRPALEDMLGAGAIMMELHHLSTSPEARAAVSCFQLLQPRLGHHLCECGSGRELRQIGFEEDVHFAAALNVSNVVPRLMDNAYSTGR
jgi:2-phosphosulfolactate phosphatase